jgi:hypothetical protein
MTKFEDQLFDELMEQHGDALATAERPRRNTRGVWIAAGAAGAAGAAILGLTVFSGGTPAYAVDENPDGSVSVSIKDPSGIGPANEELARRNLPITVLPGPGEPSCPNPANGRASGQPYTEAPLKVDVRHKSGDKIFLIAYPNCGWLWVQPPAR